MQGSCSQQEASGFFQETWEWMKAALIAEESFSFFFFWKRCLFLDKTKQNQRRFLSSLLLFLILLFWLCPYLSDLFLDYTQACQQIPNSLETFRILTHGFSSTQWKRLLYSSSSFVHTVFQLPGILWIVLFLLIVLLRTWLCKCQNNNNNGHQLSSRNFLYYNHYDLI